MQTNDLGLEGDMQTNEGAKPERKKEVQEQVDRLESAMNGAKEMQSAMRERLFDVLRQEPNAEGTPLQDKDELTPLANRLRTLADDLCGLNHEWDNIVGRIEA